MGINGGEVNPREFTLENNPRSTFREVADAGGAKGLTRTSEDAKTNPQNVASTRRRQQATPSSGLIQRTSGSSTTSGKQISQDSFSTGVNVSGGSGLVDGTPVSFIEVIEEDYVELNAGDQDGRDSIRSALEKRPLRISERGTRLDDFVRFESTGYVNRVNSLGFTSPPLIPTVVPPQHS